MPSEAFHLLEALLDLRNAAVGELAGALVLAAPLRIGKLHAQLVELVLEFLGAGKLFLFRLPARGQVGGFLLQGDELGFEHGQAGPRAGIALLLQRLLLDLEPDDLAIDRVEFLRLRVDLHLQPRRRFVHQVDRLVREEAVGDVAVRQRRRRDQRAVGDAHAVMRLVFVLQPAQDRDRILDARLVDIDRLEAAGERGVLLDVLLVLVERGGADAMQFAARQRRLEQVRSVHGAVGLAGADDGMHLVDEQDVGAGRGRHFLQHGLEPLLELAAILGSGDHRAHVEREQLLVLEAFRHVAVDDAQRETLDDRGLADSGLADQHRIVLGPAREHLNGAADLLVASDHRIELAVARRLGEVAGIFLEGIVGVLGRGRVGGAALAQRLDGGIEVLRRDAGVGENFSGFALPLERQRQQEALGTHEAVAGLLARLLGGIEDPREGRIKIDLPGAAAGDLRPLGQHRLDGGKRLAGIDPRSTSARRSSTA